MPHLHTRAVRVNLIFIPAANGGRFQLCKLVFFRLASGLTKCVSPQEQSTVLSYSRFYDTLIKEILLFVAKENFN